MSAEKYDKLVDIAADAELHPNFSEPEMLLVLGPDVEAMELTMAFLRDLLARKRLLLTVRNALPYFEHLQSNAELRTRITTMCERRNIPFEENGFGLAISMAQMDLMEKSCAACISTLREIGGKKVEQLLSDVLDDANEYGIESSPDHILGDPNPEARWLENDDQKRKELLELKLLAKLGYEVDANGIYCKKQPASDVPKPPQPPSE